MNKRPNIIFIMSDQHNSQVIGAMGDKEAQTPNIDKLFQAGTTYENTYCNSPLCVPSRSSMLSGQYSVKTGVHNNMQCLSSSIPTFVHSLGGAGYETVLSGRMHFVSWDQRHGFEKRMVGDITPSHAGVDNQERQYGELMRGSDQSRLSIERSGAGTSAVLAYDKTVFSEAKDYLMKRTDDRPLFMLVGTYGPHCPYVSPPKLFDHYYNALNELKLPEGYKENVHPAVKKWYANRGVSEVSAEDVKRIRAAYYGMVSYLDKLIGNFIETVEDSLDMDNTIIIYGSDHGDNIGEHGLFWKTNFYEGASRVPLVFRWDQHIEAGKRISTPISLVDLAPTFTAIAEAEKLPRSDGESLTPSLLEGTEQKTRDILSFCADIKGDNPSVMIRRGVYKMVLHAGYERPQLFKLDDDPDEYDDLGNSPAHRHVREEMKDALKGIWNDQKALKELELNKAEVAIMKRWGEATKPEAVDEWYGDKQNNHIMYKKPN